MSLKSSSLLVGMRILSSQWKGKSNGDVRGPVSRQPVLHPTQPPPPRPPPGGWLGFSASLGRSLNHQGNKPSTSPLYICVKLWF